MNYCTVVKATASKTVDALGCWDLTLACGATMRRLKMRTREGRLKPPPIRVRCDCKTKGEQA